MRISVGVQTILTFTISHFLIIMVAAAPQDQKLEYRTAYSVSERRTENQLQGTIGVTQPQTESAARGSAAKELGMYGMSTPTYESLESQLQSPSIVMKNPTRIINFQRS